MSFVVGNPLSLTPGTAATVTLGQIQTLANFNRSIATSDISYSDTDLATRSYIVRLPLGYNPNDPTKKYGLVTWIDSNDTPAFPTNYADALDAHDLIWLGGTGIGNFVNNDQNMGGRPTNLRRGVALMGAFRMTELYNIDLARIYVGGLSGGGRTASDLAYLRSDYLRGFIGRVGSSLPGTIPGWESAGTNSGNADSDYEYMAVNAADPSVVLPLYFRTAIMTQYGDFRRAENMAIYRWGHLNHGNTVRLVLRSGGHSDEKGDSFTDALNFLYHPLVDIIWDRFENANLAANVHAGKTVAGSGFTALSGTVSETTYSYNTVPHGVLRLTGTGAAVRSNDTFAWQSPTGILVDARLRGETAITANQNQQIGLHIVPAAATGAPADQPGLHVFWCYGATYRAELVSATGTRKTLATWQHTATHPMSLGTTEEKTFWGDAAAPDYAGKTKSFRGEDVRLVLNSGGFQLTLNRYAANIVAATGVTLQSSDASTPYAENIPMVIQGFWSDIDSALINALPTGEWRLALSNNAIVTGQPVGNAVIDEIRVVGSSGPQAAPVLTVTAAANTTRTLAWTQIHGAMGYVIQRADLPDGPFATLTTLANTASTHTDTVAQNVAYYYRVAAIGKDGATGTWSLIGFAARNVTVPAAPTSPAVTYPANYQARLAWTDAATNETGYRIERSRAGTAQWSLVVSALAAGTTAYIDTTVAAGTSYDYRISAYGTGGISGYASLTATVPDVAPPVPAGLVATTTYTTASLSWNTVAQANSYRVKRASVSGGPYTTIASALVSPTYSDTTLSPGTTSYYVVSAVGNVLESANSAEASAATPALLAPATFTVTPGFTTNALSWSAVVDVGSYTVQRATSVGGPYATLISGLAATTYADTGLLTGTTYFYRIVSVSGAAQSAPTAPTSAAPVAGTATKADNTTALDIGSSWNTGVPPTSADTASWNGTYANGSVGIGTGLTANLLQIIGPSRAITINAGTGPLAVGAGGLDLSTATQNFTVNAPIVLAASQSWTVASGRTLTFAAPVTASAGTPTLTFGGAGTFAYDAANATTPFAARLVASGGVFVVNQPSAVATLTATNLPASSTASFTTITGASGATVVVDAAPTAALAFAGNTAGFNLVVKSGNVTYNAVTGNTDATNVRVEGGTFTVAATSARYQIASPNQTFQLTGGTADISKVTSFGFRIGGTGSATQAGAQTVVATQSGGTLIASFASVGGTDTSSTKSPSYALSGGTFRVGTTLQLGADTGGLGTSTFALSGSGKLFVPGTLSGEQSGARQIFAFTGGTLVAGAITATNLRSADLAANGTLTQSGGTLAPGDLGTAGRTAITGHYVLSAAGTLAVDLGGSIQATAYQTGQYDYLTVSETTTFSGTLAINLINGFTPSNASTFTVLNSTGALTGTFANVAFGSRLATTGGEGSFLVSKSGNTVVLSAYQPALTALQSWRLANFGTSANTGTAADTADFDGDGAPNLLEYALGTTPTNAASASVPTPQVSGLRLQVSFLRARADVTYLVEATSDLASGSWTTLTTNPGTIGQSVTVTDTADLATTPGRFLRLRITAP